MRSRSPRNRHFFGYVQQRPEATLQTVRRLNMPQHHDVRPSDVDLRRLGAVLAVAYEREFRDFASLLLLENLGRVRYSR